MIASICHSISSIVSLKTLVSPSIVGSRGWLPCGRVRNSGSLVGGPSGSSRKGPSPSGPARLPTNRRTLSCDLRSWSLQPAGRTGVGEALGATDGAALGAADGAGVGASDGAGVAGLGDGP